jgi:tRNA(Ile)-lysidine synthase
MLSTMLMKGVAVSGGMDSMAMCTLLKYHREAEGWPENIFAYTIDHGVRPESAEEAAGVAKLVTDMGTLHLSNV